MSRLRFAAFLLSGVALAACSSNSEPAHMAQMRASERALSGELDVQLRRAQLLRTQGNYTEAAQAISQIMIAVPDDPRVVGEYGKLLAQKGLPEDAIAFLRRAAELNSNDWTIYSAMGVAYDQLNDPGQARIAYDRALALKPGEPSVLNNYAMSRMLANDLPHAARLIHQAKLSGGSDPKIKRNAEMIAGLMPPEAARPMTPQTPAMAHAPQAAPVMPVARGEAPKPVTAAPQPFVSTSAKPVAQPLPPIAPASQDSRRPSTAPRSLQPQMGANKTSQQTASAQRAPVKMGPQVMMQDVPFDPLAGPVAQREAEKPIKLKPPVKRAVAKAKTPKADAAKVQVAKTDDAKPAKAEAPKTQTVKSNTKPGAKATGNTEPAKPQTKPAGKPVKTQFAEKDEPKASQDGIPSLRMAADSD